MTTDISLVTSAQSVPVFCSRLKTHLFSRSFRWLYCCACEVTLVINRCFYLLTYLLTYVSNLTVAQHTRVPAVGDGSLASAGRVVMHAVVLRLPTYVRLSRFPLGNSREYSWQQSWIYWIHTISNLAARATLAYLGDPVRGPAKGECSC